MYHGEAIDILEEISNIIMGDPFSLLATGIGFTVTTSRFIAQLNAVRDETGIVIKQAKTITEDIAEAEELYLEQKPSLSDRNQFRIEEVIKDTKWAVNKIAKQVEPARRGLAKSGTINVVDRFDWIFRKSSATKSHQDHLAACHGSLLGQISKLRMAKTTARSSDPPPYEEISRDSQVTHDIVRTSPSGKAEKEESNRHRDNKRHLDRSGIQVGNCLQYSKTNFL